MSTEKLDHSSVVPLYHQLKERLKENIESGCWKPGDMIPSEQQLMEIYQISRNTVKRALEDLVQVGYLYRIQGKGTFVSVPKIEQSLSGFYSFSRVMKEKGMNPKDVIISLEKIQGSGSILNHLHLPSASPLFELKRLRFAREEPVILETSYIPWNRFRTLTKEMLKHKSLYDLMQQEFGVFVIKAREMFEPVLIRRYESTYLQIKEGYPALLLDRIAYEADGTPVEFCRAVIRGDRCRFFTELM